MEASPKNPGLQTIADLVGVSRATVSLALRNQACISESTRARIKQVAADLDYRPNPLVSTLMAHIKSRRPLQDAGAIAFLTSHPKRNEWRKYSTLARYFAGASERAQMAGYRLSEMWLKEPGMTARKMRSILINRGIQGILVAPLPRGAGHLSMDVSTFAVATMGHTVVRPKIHRAVHRHIEALRIAVRNLRHLGYRRIALALDEGQDIRNDFHWSTAFAGYQQGRTPKERIPLFFLDRKDDAQFACWLDRWKPDVILSGNSTILARLKKVGVAVPEDVGVAVLDLEVTDQGVTGIDQLPEVVASTAIDMIVGQIQRNECGIPAQAKLTLTDGIWVPGATVRRVSPKTTSDDSAGTTKETKQKQGAGTH